MPPIPGRPVATPLPVFTVSPLRNGSFLYWNPDMTREEFNRIKMSVPKTVAGEIEKWQRIIRASVKAKRACVARLIRAVEGSYWQGNATVVTDEMTIRVKGNS